MKKCQECGTPLTGRQKQFCSITCRNKPNGRKTGGWNRAPVKVVCQNCDRIFTVPPYRVPTARACSKQCLGAIQSRERKGRVRKELGIQTYRRARKESCERCGSTQHLCVHHKDENRYNNQLANLETLCKRCHQIHHGAGRNLPKGLRPWNKPPERACEGCGTIFQPRGKQRFCTQLCWLVTLNTDGRQLPQVSPSQRPC